MLIPPMIQVQCAPSAIACKNSISKRLAFTPPPVTGLAR